MNEVDLLLSSSDFLRTRKPRLLNDPGLAASGRGISESFRRFTSMEHPRV